MVWNRRLQLFAPAGSPPANISRIGSKYGFNENDAKAAGARTAESLRALTTQLKSQYAGGVPYFVGDSVSELDKRSGHQEALDPLLLEHRSQIFREHFCDPMEL